MTYDASALREASKRYSMAQRHVGSTREELYRAIRRAASAGMSLRAIADETALSHQRVAQILGYQPPPSPTADRGD